MKRHVKLNVKGRVTVAVCPCGFVSAMILPYRHIFAVRWIKGISQYNESLCADRWKLSHFTKFHHIYQIKETDNEDEHSQSLVEISQHVPSPTRSSNIVLSEQRKYRKAFKIAQSLSQQLSSFGMKDFTEGIDALQTARERERKVLISEECGKCL